MSDKRGNKEERKLRKLNKLHEIDLSGISLGDSVILKTKGIIKQLQEV